MLRPNDPDPIKKREFLYVQDLLVTCFDIERKQRNIGKITERPVVRRDGDLICPVIEQIQGTLDPPEPLPPCSCTLVIWWNQDKGVK